MRIASSVQNSIRFCMTFHLKACQARISLVLVLPHDLLGFSSEPK